MSVRPRDPARYYCEMFDKTVSKNNMTYAAFVYNDKVVNELKKTSPNTDVNELIDAYIKEKSGKKKLTIKNCTGYFTPETWPYKFKQFTFGNGVLVNDMVNYEMKIILRDIFNFIKNDYMTPDTGNINLTSNLIDQMSHYIKIGYLNENHVSSQTLEFFKWFDDYKKVEDKKPLKDKFTIDIERFMTEFSVPSPSNELINNKRKYGPSIDEFNTYFEITRMLSYLTHNRKYSRHGQTDDEKISFTIKEGNTIINNAKWIDAQYNPSVFDKINEVTLENYYFNKKIEVTKKTKDGEKTSEVYQLYHDADKLPSYISPIVAKTFDEVYAGVENVKYIKNFNFNLIITAYYHSLVRNIVSDLIDRFTKYPIKTTDMNTFNNKQLQKIFIKKFTDRRSIKDFPDDTDNQHIIALKEFKLC